MKQSGVIACVFLQTIYLSARTFSASVITELLFFSVAPPPFPLATTTFVAPGSSSVHGQPRRGNLFLNPQCL